MKFVADIHLHSHYSRATSKDLNLEYLDKWAQLKGVQVVGSGDIAHPGWLKEMKEKLQPAEEGLFRLKEEYADALQREVPGACRGPVRFMLAGEISNIYKKNEKVRKIHNVVFLPSFEAVEKLQAALDRIGNIRSDGRPILGLDARDLLEIVLETDPQGYLIPAHIWTPWFSLFGSMSGFDTIEECFEDLTKHIFALETGLSSDPAMNWRCSALDRYTLVSNSDAHSPQKLAREANVFNTGLSYRAIFEALKSGDPQKFLGTIEFFPEEGKYHYDGHRKCGICWDPKTTITHRGICPKCGKPVTIGVMHRVEVLADREEGEKPARVQPFESLIPLPEVLAEVYGVGVNTRRVRQTYEQLLSKLGPELAILRDLPLEDIQRNGGTPLAEGIRRIRSREVSVAAGFDGEYGVIKLFDDTATGMFDSQLDLFGVSDNPGAIRASSKPLQLNLPAPTRRERQIPLSSPDSASTELSTAVEQGSEKPGLQKQPQEAEHTIVTIPQTPGHRSMPEKLAAGLQGPLEGLNPRQREAVQFTGVPLIILAGPGTGKTRTLTRRMAFLISEKGVPPEQLLAITFTNKAAEEMRQRLRGLLGEAIGRKMCIKTFHAFGAMVLREEGHRIDRLSGFSILSENNRFILLKKCCPGLKDRALRQYLDQISGAKSRLLSVESSRLARLYPNHPDFPAIYQSYESFLRENHSLDYDDLILAAVQLLEVFPEVLNGYCQRYRWISVDEYQDINFAQYYFLKLLASREANLCVIGDPDQAIYGFRGADRQYFLKFQKDYPTAQTIHLSRNYRSSQLILKASKQVIARNSDRLDLDLWSDIVGSTRVEIYSAPTHKAEAEYVVHQIEKMVGGTSYFSLDSGRVESDDESTSRSFSDFAVFYRLSALSQDLVEAFQRSGIPFQSVGQTPFYERKEIQEMLACLWLINNPGLNFYREICPINAGHFDRFMNESQRSFKNWPVASLIERVNQLITSQRPAVATPERSELISTLKLKASLFEDRLENFLESTVMQKETDEYDPRADRVTLMTLHASKGLEFPVVFIVGCEEEIIPYRRGQEKIDLAEERRLFYVGMTRAKEKLVLVRAASRFLYGRSCQNAPSRFLNDIENALKEVKQSTPGKPGQSKKDDAQLNLF